MCSCAFDLRKHTAIPCSGAEQWLENKYDDKSTSTVPLSPPLSPLLETRYLNGRKQGRDSGDGKEPEQKCCGYCFQMGDFLQQRETKQKSELFFITLHGGGGGAS